jgi:alanine racemase
MRPIKARIHLDALRHNLGIARARAPRSRVWAVVKANAYGHGVRRAAQALQGADGLALLELDAALDLRKSGEQRPMLLLEGFFSPRELPDIVSNRLQVVVHSLEQVVMIERAKLDGKIGVYLKANTGMNRLGLDERDFRTALTRLQASAFVDGITLMTHFADAESNEAIRIQS